MSQLTINIGRAANDRSGDPLRTAFEKVNANFTELYANLSTYLPSPAGQNGKVLSTDGTNLVWITQATPPTDLVVTVGTTPPITHPTGTLWYDEISGRMYVYYDSNWIDASPKTSSITLTSGTKAANATGTTGQISYDADYIYICTATNTWKRAPLTGGY